MPEAIVNGVTLNYEVEGQGEQVILSIAGFGGSARCNLISLAPLAKHYKIIAFDIRGHGQSAHVTENWTLQQIANDIYEFIKRYKLNNVIGLGESMGGAILLRLVLDHPEVLSKIVLLSSMTANGATTPKEIIEQALTMTFSREMNIAMVKSLFLRPFTPEIERMVEETIDDTLLVSDSVKRAWLLKEQYYNWEDQISTIKTPALIMYGDKDIICNPQDQHRMAELIPNSQEIIIPDTGHAMIFEEPEKVFSEVIRFIGN